jgi:hypothetical protein
MSATKRIDRGRGHSYLLDGAEVDGVTTIINGGVPKPALINWAARETAGYAVDHWDELATLGLAERLRRLEKARFETVKGAAIRGTDIHTHALALARGQEVDVPDHLVGHVDAYLRFTEDWRPEELLTEAIVGNRRYRYMGTLDTIAFLADGATWLLDWKTSASGIYPENALQLNAYQHAEFYLDETGAEKPLPRIDRLGCVWLRADGYDLVPVTQSPDVFRTFLYAQQIARFTGANRSSYVGETLTAPEPVAE